MIGKLIRNIFYAFIVVVIIIGVLYYGPERAVLKFGSGVEKVLGMVDDGLSKVPDDPEVAADNLSERVRTEVDGLAEKVGADKFTNALKLDNFPALSQTLEDMRQTQIGLPESSKGYDRDEFPHWENAFELGNGWDVGNKKCDVREAALIRDGIDVEYDKNCKITSGKWIDGYGVEKNGKVEFKEYDNPRKLDADHVIALAEAYRSGAKDWDEEKKKMFANDPLNIMISSASANRSKGDQSAATYLPPLADNAASRRCEYVSRYISVKDKYDLTFTPSELDALDTALQQCQ